MSGGDRALLFGAGIPLLAAALVLAWRKGAFLSDEFPRPWRRWLAFSLLFLVLVATALLPATTAGREVDVSRLRFASLFLTQGILAAFLFAWWLLSGRPDVAGFLSLRSKRPLAEVGAGLCLGPIGWALTFLLGVLVALLVSAAGLPAPRGVPPLVRWMAALPLVERLLIVLAAMTVEELYFRGFLQRRLGPLPASGFFLVAHAGYGEPLFFVGLLGITAVLAAAYEKTRSTLAPMAAHGAFNAIQLFLVLPAVMRVLEAP